MKTYTVMIIGESGKYETVASGVNGRLAGELAEEYRFNANVNRYRNCGY